VDLDERVDEVRREIAASRLGLEPRYELVRHDLAVEVRHDVERHAEHGLVLRDRDDRRQAREPGLAQRQLELRLAHHVVRRGR
jgi:hypothetical protein